MTALARCAAVGGAIVVTIVLGHARAESGSDSGSGSGSGSGSAKPAGSSPVESSDVPVWTANPPRFAVVPFENHTGQKTSEWMTWGAPFELAEKTEAVVGMMPTAPPFFVGATEVPADPGPVADFARTQDATWVMTGWFDRVNLDMRLDVVLWHVVGGKAKVAKESQRQGPPAAYHRLVGEALAELWSVADPVKAQKLGRALAIDLYAVNLMGKGLGHLLAGLALPPDPKPSATSPRNVELAGAKHDLERAVFIDPKCFEAQRLLGELELAENPGDPKAAARAAGKFNYASDLAPDDIGALRAAALATAASGKWELASEMFRRLVTRQPWDLEARYQLGAALWHVGDVDAAARQLDQVVAHAADHLPARRVLALIHASRSDTPKLVAELEAIAARAPDDLEVKADLASAYAALGKWDRAATTLEVIAAARPNDLALLVRIADVHQMQHDLEGALAWYARAQKVAPESSYPAFASAQALYDAGKLPEANHAYTGLQRWKDDLPAAEQALGAIALRQGRADDAAWYLRRAAREAPRSLMTWQTLIAAELTRKDAATARKLVDRAREFWPLDADLRYLDAIAHNLAGERDETRVALVAALDARRDHPAARTALAAFDAGGTIGLEFAPELVRPWGDTAGYQRTLDEFTLIASSMGLTRVLYQNAVLEMLGELGIGPHAKVKPGSVKACPLSRLAPHWAIGNETLARYTRLGDELEARYRYIARHDDIGASAALLPNARTQVAGAKKTFRTALADIGELRAEWTRSLGPELRAVGCTDRLLAAAVADPARYHIIEGDQPVVVPTTTAPRPRARATFYVDNTECNEAVDVWIDGAQLGHVPPKHASALVADGGERALCLIVPGAAPCGDRGTVRQVYLHDGWRVTLHCPKDPPK